MVLESLIEPLILNSAKKYIANLDISALRLSIFGGDVVLQNLELKLEVLRQEFAAGLPIHFRRGFVREAERREKRKRFLFAPVADARAGDDARERRDGVGRVVPGPVAALVAGQAPPRRGLPGRVSDVALVPQERERVEGRQRVVEAQSHGAEEPRGDGGALGHEAGANLSPVPVRDASTAALTSRRRPCPTAPHRSSL